MRVYKIWDKLGNHYTTLGYSKREYYYVFPTTAFKNTRLSKEDLEKRYEVHNFELTLTDKKIFNVNKKEVKC